MAPGKFQVKFDKGKASVETKLKAPDRKLAGKIERVGTTTKFIPDSVDQGFDTFFETFVGKITELRLTKSKNDSIFTLCGELINESMAMCERFFQKGQTNETERDVVLKSKEYILKHISTVKTAHLREKRFRESKYFVAPIEKAMGLKWKTKATVDLDLLDHSLKQTTFQFVPISKTLAALFANPDFSSMFLEYNERRSQKGCTDGVYEDFCCGNVSKNSEILSAKYSIVLQFGMDEVDLCCGLKSKATTHKMLSVYFQIRNVPTKYASRLSNIFLVALCNSSNFKETGVCDDKIIEEIVRDLKELEKIGIDIGDGTRLKVGVLNCANDNLGANVLLGFPGGFNAKYFCRFCTCKKKETQILTTEDVSKIRTKESYDEQVEKLKLNPELKSKDTDGVRKNCGLNELETFHACKNLSADIMHDVLEGIVPRFLRQFFEYCISRKLCSENDLVRRIRDFRYGALNSRNKPSKLNIDRLNLGQNASQLYCMMIHIPFMFIDKQCALHEVWPIMISLLEIMRIVFSFKICDSDLQLLLKYSDEHLSGMKNLFGIKLKPKHHNLIHYVRIIKEMGPLRYSWMMRFESKHKFFTDAAKKTNNLINITKSLAEIHQAYICTQTNSFKDEIAPSKKKYALTKDDEYKQYRLLFESINEIDVKSCVAFKFLKFNGLIYRKGLLILFEHKISEIIYVLSSNNEFQLICHIYECVELKNSLNSIEIRKTALLPENIRIINVKNLTSNDNFEKKLADGKIFVILENLDLLKCIQ